MTALRLAALLAFLAALPLSPETALAGGFNLRKALQATGLKTRPVAKARTGAMSQVRLRANTIRTAIKVHKSLVSRKTAVKMPQSKILKNHVAAAKKYADSWTCRESSRMLLKKLTGTDVKLTLGSSGKGAFDWGAEGKVSYHYYAVDNQAAPKLLIDPTAASNFAVDARPKGMMHNLLKEAGKRLGQPKAAARVTRRLARGGIQGMLVLANPADIAVYRDALDAAGRMQAQRMTNGSGE